MVNETNQTCEFIYTILFTESTLHDITGWTCPSSVYNMSQSGTGTGGSSGEDKRPITGHFNSEDWVGGLHDYLTSVTDRHPGDPDHPSGDWFGQGVEIAALDQGRAVTSTPK